MHNPDCLICDFGANRNWLNLKQNQNNPDFNMVVCTASMINQQWSMLGNNVRQRENETSVNLRCTVKLLNSTNPPNGTSHVTTSSWQRTPVCMHSQTHSPHSCILDSGVTMISSAILQWSASNLASSSELWSSWCVVFLEVNRSRYRRVSILEVRTGWTEFDRTQLC